MRYARNGLFASLFLTVGWLGACKDTQPSAPEIPSVRAAKGGGKPLKVNETDPSVGEQGTVDLSVRVLGSGFDDGSSGPPFVTWLLDGDPTGVATNSVAFGANPDKELLTTITIDDDARLGLWDVEVQTRRGKKGIGMERFEVKEQNAPGTDFWAPTIVTLRDAPSDNIRSDDEVRDDPKYAGPPYEDGVCGVWSDVGSAQDARLSPRGRWTGRYKKSCGETRKLVFEFDAPDDLATPKATVVDAIPMNIDDVTTVPNGATELRLGQFNLCDRLLFNPDDSWSPDNGSDLLLVTFDEHDPATDADDEWIVETQPFPNDKGYCDDDGRLWHMPFRLIIRGKP